MVQALPFADRSQAGAELAEAVVRLRLDRPLVLGVPRGGVAVAVPVAHGTRGDLDVVVVRKIGAPRNPELGLGAVAAAGEAVVDESLVASLGVSREYLDREIDEQREECRRRLAAYRGDDAQPDIAGRDVVVVDDGIATGGTVAAAGRILRTQGPARLVLAVPVAPSPSLERVRDVYDDVVCLATPEPFLAVGQWYEDFHQVTDEEVRGALGA